LLTQNDITRLTGTDVYDTEGDKIGSVGQVYLDAQTGDPQWVTVETGLFGTRETFVPLRGAGVTDERVTVAYGKDRVKDAPQIEADGPMSHTEEDQLYRYYDLASGDGRSDDYQTDRGFVDGTPAGEKADDNDHPNGGDGSMTRSEERLVTDTRTEEAGKARLRKYVVTEQQQVTVPVSREEVRLEREPITDANAAGAYDGPAISEAEHEVTLHAERPVVNTETVPVERVRLGKETIQDEETVDGEVRKEQIEFDGPDRR
jgi:uncharacterized protein (TIGR02271 family)